MDEISRREFMRKMIALGFSAVGASFLVSNSGCTTPSAVSTAAPNLASVGSAVVPAGAAYLAVARGESPTAMVQAALKAIGGIERFVKSGNDVIIKPNICNASNTYEYASTTNPEVVAALVKLCLGACAKRVRVMDYPFSGTAEVAYVRSGIADAVNAAGGQMEVMSARKFQEITIPKGQDLKRWKIYQDILDTDVLINVPIAKHHGMTGVTLGMKNLMGMIEDRGSLHTNLGQRIADIATVLMPELTIIDGVRILLRNGPTGGDLNDVKKTDTIIASHDIVAADAYATRLFNTTPDAIDYIVRGAKMGLGTLDLKSIKIEEISA